MPAPKIPHDTETRTALAKSFIENVVFAQYRQLTGWQQVTQQSAQLDSGYLAQHLVSLVSGTPGRGPGSRGKGDDLLDGSEIKAASTIGAIDVPRWNHSNLGRKDKVKAYLANPYVYFVLFDTAVRGEVFPLRIRVWRVAPQRDQAFATVVKTWTAGKSSGNFQLHPPCWKAESVARNESGNLSLPLIFEAVQREIEGVDFMDIAVWNPRAGKSRRV
jgi:MamI restriction endonuclease